MLVLSGVAVALVSLDHFDGHTNDIIIHIHSRTVLPLISQFDEKVTQVLCDGFVIDHVAAFVHIVAGVLVQGDGHLVFNVDMVDKVADALVVLLGHRAVFFFSAGVMQQFLLQHVREADGQLVDVLLRQLAVGVGHHQRGRIHKGGSQRHKQRAQAQH